MRKKQNHRARGSIEGEKHPYMRDSLWINGTLCFWRDRPMMYTKESHEYYENWIASKMDQVKNVATIQPNIQRR